MMEAPKFTVEYSKLLCEILSIRIARLELVKFFPKADDDLTLGDVKHGVCHPLIKKKSFVCQGVQGFPNEFKFNDDCSQLICLLRNIVDELEESQTINKLIQHVDDTSQEFLDTHLTINDFLDKLKAAETLEEISKHQKEYDLQKILALDTEVFNRRILRCQYELELKTEKNFNIAWVESEVRQQEIRLSKEEKHMKEKLLDVTFRSCETDDAYFRTCKFYKEKIMQLNDKIRFFNSKYDSQLEQVETDLQIALNERKHQLKVIKIERDLFRKREQEMECYQEEKRKKQAEKKLLQLQEVKSVVIQSWWRGVMVRSYYGQFKSFKKRAKQLKKQLREEQRKKR